MTREESSFRESMEPVVDFDDEDMDSRLGWTEPATESTRSSGHRSDSEKFTSAVFALAWATKTKADVIAMRIVLGCDERLPAQAAREEKISRQLLQHSLAKLRKVAAEATK